MGLDELKAGSTYPFRWRRVMDVDLTAATEPSSFTYAGPGGFTLPPTHLATFDSSAAIIERIYVSPHLEALWLEDAIRLIDTVGGIMASAGWKREDQNMVGIDELRVRAQNPSESESVRWPVAGYMLGSVEALLTIKQVDRASGLSGLLGSKDTYLMKVEMSDAALSARLDRVTAALNQRDGTTLPRAVELEPYLARVRTMLAHGGYGVPPCSGATRQARPAWLPAPNRLSTPAHSLHSGCLPVLQAPMTLMHITPTQMLMFEAAGCTRRSCAAWCETCVAALRHPW